MELITNQKHLILSFAAVSAASALSYLFSLFQTRNSSRATVAEDNHFRLTREEAFQRSNHLHVNNYILFLYLPHSFSKIYAKHYYGSVIINFNFVNMTDEFFIDFAGKVDKIILNSCETNNYWIRENRIYFKKDDILNGNNIIQICFRNSYSSSSFIFGDENDYFFLRKEPFFTHLTFPCFDQPNLKASFKLYVVTQPYLQVNSLECKKFLNTAEISIIEDPSSIQSKFSEFKLDIKPNSFDYVLKEFAETKLVTTYNFALILGNFNVVENVLNYDLNNRTNIKLFFRKSSSIANQSVIDSTKKYIIQIIDYYNEIFQINLPLFKVLNIHFLPEKKSMDFCSNIILFESFISENLNPVDLIYFYTSLSSYIANMWTINQFSLNWWEDRYLFEAIGVFLGHLCISKLENKETPWILFSFYKLKALRADSTETHILRTEIVDTESARILYDEILGNKYVCLIQCLYSFLGENKFLLFISKLIEESYSHNMSLDIFIEYLNVQNNSQVSKIFEDYIENEGFSELELELEIITKNESRKISKASISQKQNYLHLYYHKLDVLLIYTNRTEIITTEILPELNTKINALIGKDEPKAIILNYNDKAYCRQIFTNNNLKFIINKIEDINDDLTKTVIARDLFGMVQHGDDHINPYVFINFCKNVFKNNNLQSPAFVIQLIAFAKCVTFNYISFNNQFSISNILVEIISSLIFSYSCIKDILLNDLLDVINSSFNDHFQMLINSMLNVKKSEYSIHVNLRILNLENISNNNKLRLLEAIFESDIPQYEDKVNIKRTFLQYYQENDLPYSYETVLDACLPSSTRKKGYWLTLVYKDLNLSWEKYEAIMRGFSRKNQYELLKYYFKTSFFEDFPFVLSNNGKDYAIMFFKYLNPSFLVNKNILDKFENLLSNIPETENEIKVLVISKITQMKSYLKVLE